MVAALLVLSAVQLVGALAAPGKVYTVAQVRAGISRDPQLWRGRTVLIRALAVPLGAMCPPSTPWCTNVVLADHDPILATTPTLDEMAPRSNPYVTLLRRLPLVDWVIPDPQQVAWEQLATYRLHISPQTFTPCLAPCLNLQLEGIAR